METQKKLCPQDNQQQNETALRRLCFYTCLPKGKTLTQEEVDKIAKNLLETEEHAEKHNIEELFIPCCFSYVKSK